MVKSELYSNLRDVVELLYDSLLPEGSNAVSCRDSEEELNLLQEEISALDYSCLDEIYHAGPEEVVNDDLSPMENALISSVGLLDEYSLSEKEFREWIEKQPETYRPLLNMLTGVQPTPYYTEKMKTDFAEEFRKQLFDPAKSNTSPKNGMHFAEEQPDDGSQNFRYLKKVLVFDKEFDDYNRVVQELRPIIQKARSFYLYKQADALEQKEACGDHFYETLMTFAQASNTLFSTNLLTIQPGSQKTLTGTLVQIGNFFFGLFKGQLDLLLCQGHQILVDALQDEVYICPCHGNAAGHGFFVGLGVDVVLFQKHQSDALMVEVFVQSKTFFCISGHPGY